MFLMLLVFLGSTAAFDFGCWHKKFGSDSTVCICNLFYCDFTHEVGKIENSQYVQYISSRDGQRLRRTTGYLQQQLPNQKYDSMLNISSSKTYQTIKGFGGAFTDSTGINIQNLIYKSLRDNLMKSYFGKQGIGYTFGRVPMAGTDFSTRAYTYDDNPGDINLTSFSLANEDTTYKIPMIKQAMKLSGNTLKLIGTPWASPAWMKTNNKIYGLGFLLDEMYQPWANYYLKFLQEYEKQGVNFWGVTTGNEPTIAIILPDIKLNSLTWRNEDQRKWIAENLGPTIKSKYPNTKIIAWDDQRFMLPYAVNWLFNDTRTRNYVDGIGVHWYYDTNMPASSLTETNYYNPDKFILATEASIIAIPSLGNWTNAELYANDIIEDLQNWVTGWIDWNMVLDTNGGPTYIGNYLDSPIIVDNFKQEFYKQPMYYIMGHFSKFIDPGSKRIDANFNSQHINSVAFIRPDNSTVAVLFNNHDQEYTIMINDQKGFIPLNIVKRSITTIIY